MPLLPIVKVGDPVLRKKTQPIKKVDEVLQQLIADMFVTMYAAPGIGLAANQVGISRCLAVIDLQPGGRRQPFVIINPVIEETTGKIEEEEGCLSIPGFGGKVKRAAKVRVKALNEHGLPVMIEGEGLMARCLQHEIDHLNGKLYIDRMPLIPRLRIKRQIANRKKSGLF